MIFRKHDTFHHPTASLDALMKLYYGETCQIINTSTTRLKLIFLIGFALGKHRINELLI